MKTITMDVRKLVEATLSYEFGASWSALTLNERLHLVRDVHDMTSEGDAPTFADATRLLNRRIGGPDALKSYAASLARVAFLATAAKKRDALAQRHEQETARGALHAELVEVENRTDGVANDVPVSLTLTRDQLSMLIEALETAQDVADGDIESE